MDQDEVRRALAAADAAYEPFAPFSQWASEPMALGSWDDAAAHLASVREAAPAEAVDVALDEALRAAAVDTGAIEGLYRADRGFTLSVARNVISLDQAEVEAGPGFRRSFEAQLAGFELALQMATGDEVITEAAIREVHRVTCADDSTYRVLTEHGVQERGLVLGAYKAETNHVQLADGTWHAYAPVDRVTEEVHRLVEEMRTEAFRAAHPVVQAAFVHHAFTSVHPFADGNGRVARLLASIPLLRAASIPLWVEVADRPRYIDALGAADRGDRQPCLRFVTSTTLSLLRELDVHLTGWTPIAEPSPERHAARRVATALFDALLLLTAGVRRASVERFTVMPDLPNHVFVDDQSVLALNARGSILRSSTVLVAVGLDMEAAEESRVVVFVYDSPYAGQMIARHHFALDETTPEISAAAHRRVTALARSLWTEAQRRRDAPSV